MEPGLSERRPPWRIGLDDVLAQPHAVAGYLLTSSVIYGLTEVHVQIASGELSIFWMELEPWAPMAASDYPVERVSISAWANGRITAVPLDPHKRP